jgi:DnaK suppressor protein
MSIRNLNVNLYKAALLEKAAEYRKDLEDARTEISIEAAPEPMEHGVRSSEREAAIERMKIADRQLRRVEAALSRIERDEYGICVKCEDYIGNKRLDALPWAILCVQCQEDAERLREGGRALRQAA